MANSDVKNHLKEPAGPELIALVPYNNYMAEPSSCQNTKSIELDDLRVCVNYISDVNKDYSDFIQKNSREIVKHKEIREIAARFHEVNAQLVGCFVNLENHLKKAIAQEERFSRALIGVESYSLKEMKESMEIICNCIPNPIPDNFSQDLKEIHESQIKVHKEIEEQLRLMSAKTKKNSMMRLLQSYENIGKIYLSALRAIFTGDLATMEYLTTNMPKMVWSELMAPLSAASTDQDQFNRTEKEALECMNKRELVVSGIAEIRETVKEINCSIETRRTMVNFILEMIPCLQFLSWFPFLKCLISWIPSFQETGREVLKEKVTKLGKESAALGTKMRDFSADLNIHRDKIDAARLELKKILPTTPLGRKKIN